MAGTKGNGVSRDMSRNAIRAEARFDRPIAGAGLVIPDYSRPAKHGACCGADVIRSPLPLPLPLRLASTDAAANNKSKIPTMKTKRNTPELRSSRLGIPLVTVFAVSFGLSAADAADWTGTNRHGLEHTEGWAWPDTWLSVAAAKRHSL
jgi:hypothetical protein